MQKIMFNERYGLQSAVFEGRKTQTRREPFYAESVCCEFNRQGKLECFTYDDEREYPIHTSRYAKGEIVAVAQSYKEIGLDPNQCVGTIDYGGNMYMPLCAGESKGWNNKMFVLADEMPHHIKILDIRCERLQDISESDCIKEGISYSASAYYSCELWDKKKNIVHFNFSPKGAFCTLMGKLNGNKFWESNPYVIVYEFKKID